MFGNKKESYKDSEAYLKRQQDIDYLLVLTKLLEPGMTAVQEDTQKEANKQIANLLDKLK